MAKKKTRTQKQEGPSTLVVLGVIALVIVLLTKGSDLRGQLIGAPSSAGVDPTIATGDPPPPPPPEGGDEGLGGGGPALHDGAKIDPTIATGEPPPPPPPEGEDEGMGGGGPAFRNAAEEWEYHKTAPVVPAKAPQKFLQIIKDLTRRQHGEGAEASHAAASEGAEQEATPTASAGPNACGEDGVEVCRCYCRINLPVCRNNERSYASMPLCREEWSNGDCSSIAYYKTNVSSGDSCAAMDGRTCKGYIRPGNGNPEELSNERVDGRFVGCGMATL